MPLSHEDLEAIRNDCLADDIEIEDEMAGWEREAAVAYFESGGAVRPAPLVVISPPSGQADATAARTTATASTIARSIALTWR